MKRIIIDYSTCYFHEGRVTGIPRTVESLSAAIQQLSELPIEFVIFDDHEESFKYFSLNQYKVMDKYSAQSDDIFLCFGAPWQHACYLHSISDIRDTIHSFIFVLHDLIPYLFPHFYEEPEFGEYYFRFISKITALANKVLCNSRNTYYDLIRLVDDESIESKSSVIELGCDFIKVNERPSESISDLVVPNYYVLCVGTLEFRKNQNFLLKVYRKILKESKDFPCLILAGKLGFGNNQIDHQINCDPILDGKVKILDNLSDTELDYLYRNCLFTVYPSLYEGWGLPICESLMYGKNVVCSNTSSMIEVAPDLCHFADPLNQSEWCDQIIKLSEAEYRLGLERKIVQEFSAHKWIDTSKELLSTL